jgi:hypothetical protein
MSHAELIPESVIQRMAVQLAHLGVDVRVHAANVREWCERQPGLVENPVGLFVTWCQCEADHRRERAAAAARDRDRYAELQVQVFAWIAGGGVGPRLLARVLDQASREGYPALNPRTIEKLRALGPRWPELARADGSRGPQVAGARDARGREGFGPGRSLDEPSRACSPGR